MKTLLQNIQFRELLFSFREHYLNYISLAINSFSLSFLNNKYNQPIKTLPTTISKSITAGIHQTQLEDILAFITSSISSLALYFELT